ncbi:hypothetical protein GCM10027605_17180 [Micromonospora zhanjiangensis]
MIPVRETEAWLLADGEALRNTLGVRWSDADLGLPRRARDVEQISDPKKVLDQIMCRVSRPVRSHYGQLGELISLEKLREVPAYRRWWDDSRVALEALGFRPI